jgi:hypothetical protein
MTQRIRLGCLPYSSSEFEPEFGLLAEGVSGKDDLLSGVAAGGGAVCVCEELCAEISVELWVRSAVADCSLSCVSVMTCCAQRAEVPKAAASATTTHKRIAFKSSPNPSFPFGIYFDCFKSLVEPSELKFRCRRRLPVARTYGRERSAARDHCLDCFSACFSKWRSCLCCR